MAKGMSVDIIRLRNNDESKEGKINGVQFDKDSHPSWIRSQIEVDSIFDFLLNSKLKQINNNIDTEDKTN